MKKNIKFVFAQLIFLLIISAVHAGPYTDLFLYAKSLHDAGAYEEAEVEYKRYIFMQNYNDLEYETEAFCALADLYEKKQSWSLAAQYMQKAIISAREKGATQTELESLQCSHIAYLKNAAETSNEMLSENLFIFSYMNLPDFSEKTKKYAYSAAIANAVSKGRFEYAKNTFETAVEKLPDAWNSEQQQIIRTNLESLASFKPKNQKLAGYLSFFPGLGQMYAHDYKDAANAFFLNGSIIAVSVWSLCTLDFWTFSLLEFNPLIRFMQGNIYNAQKDTYQYNIKKQQELSAPILQELAQ